MGRPATQPTERHNTQAPPVVDEALKAVEKPPIVKFVFHSLIDQQLGYTLQFTYNGTLYEWEPDKTYKAPEDVVKHVESRSVPRYEYVDDGKGGMFSKQVGVSKRFMCERL